MFKCLICNRIEKTKSNFPLICKIENEFIEVVVIKKLELINLINYINETNDNDEDKLSIIKESINNLLK